LERDESAEPYAVGTSRGRVARTVPRRGTCSEPPGAKAAGLTTKAGWSRLRTGSRPGGERIPAPWPVPGA